jgi:hypothetical protein
MKYSLLFLLAFAVLACGETPNDGDSEVVTDTGEVVDLDDNPQATLDATVQAVQSAGGDITALPAGAAVDNIDTWMDALDDVNGTDKVTGNLEMLKEALGESPINGALTGMILTSLAEDTRQVAGSNAGISQLASALQAGGDKLTSGAAFQGDDLLSQTLQAGKSKMGDITTLPADAAVSNIDGWLGQLRGMDGADDVVEGLEALKMELGKGSIDGDRVADILMELAEETRELGNGNAGLATLAYLLESGGKRLEAM